MSTCSPHELKIIAKKLTKEPKYSGEAVRESLKILLNNTACWRSIVKPTFEALGVSVDGKKAILAAINKSTNERLGSEFKTIIPFVSVALGEDVEAAQALERTVDSIMNGTLAQGDITLEEENRVREVLRGQVGGGNGDEPSEEEDVCCICLDPSSEDNPRVILHNTPEGTQDHWICRACSQRPSIRALVQDGTLRCPICRQECPLPADIAARLAEHPAQVAAASLTFPNLNAIRRAQQTARDGQVGLRQRRELFPPHLRDFEMLIEDGDVVDVRRPGIIGRVRRVFTDLVFNDMGNIRDGVFVGALVVTAAALYGAMAATTPPGVSFVLELIRERPDRAMAIVVRAANEGIITMEASGRLVRQLIDARRGLDVTLGEGMTAGLGWLLGPTGGGVSSTRIHSRTKRRNKRKNKRTKRRNKRTSRRSKRRSKH